MSKYRCPLCGATHKDQVDRCRLCGQSMAPGAVSSMDQQVAVVVKAQRGTKGVIVIGLALVVSLLLAAVVFGLARENTQVRKAKDLVIGAADGWTAQVDDQGKFTVELPGTRTRQATPYPVTDDHNLTAWHAGLGDDTQVLVGWGKVSPTLTNGVLPTPAAYRFLRDTIVPRWMAANNLTDSFVTVEEGAAGGLPAVTVRTTQARLKLDDRDAYGDISFAVNGGTLYVLQVLSIYKEAPQLDRLAASFVVTGAVG